MARAFSSAVSVPISQVLFSAFLRLGLAGLTRKRIPDEF